MAEELKKLIIEINKALLQNIQERKKLQQLKDDINFLEYNKESVIDITPIREQILEKIQQKAEAMKLIKPKEKTEKKPELDDR